MVKREGGKKEIAIIVFKCDKCGHEEKYKQVRGGFVKIDNTETTETIIEVENKQEIPNKEQEQKKILWFNV